MHAHALTKYHLHINMLQLLLGGGSALDLGKAVAALMTNKDDIYNYLEIIGKGIPIQNKPAPLIAVPTTSGTGSECTKNAVLKSLAHGRKVSMRHDSMLPLAAIIDPCLSVSCPQQVSVLRRLFSVPNLCILHAFLHLHLLPIMSVPPCTNIFLSVICPSSQRNFFFSPS